MRSSRPAERRIGLLTSSDEEDPEAQAWVAAFREELRKLGWTEVATSQIDIRWTNADVGLMTRSAKELVALQPDLIVTSSTPAAGVMLQHTRTIPIVFLLVADPVGSRYVASLPRPGGNATGFTPIVGSLGGKWVELLKEIAPRLGQDQPDVQPGVGAVHRGFLGSFKAAAASLGMETNVSPVQDMREVGQIMSASEGQWRGRRDTRCLHRRPIVRRSPRWPSSSCPCHLLVPLIRRTRRPYFLWARSRR